MKKRFLAILLIISMIITLFPMTSLASQSYNFKISDGDTTITYQNNKLTAIQLSTVEINLNNKITFTGTSSNNITINASGTTQD